MMHRVVRARRDWGGVSKPLIDIENNCCFVLVVVTVVSIRAARRE
jgi:hypothetical protein